MKTRLSLFAAILALCGCSAAEGDRSVGPVERVAETIVPFFGIAGGIGADATEVPPGFGPQDLAAAPNAFQLIWLPSFTAQAGLARRIEVNPRSQTYESQYGFTASFRDGILVGTRGLADDLMGASVAQVRAAIAAGGGTVERSHDTLNGLDQIVRETYRCEVTADGQEEITLGIRQVVGAKFSESCASRRVQFENLYWLDANGEIIASRQFVTQTVAYLRSSRL